ncbi:MAG: ABC transporter ATP-binding protein [Clostridiales bacterium]|nr:ABC transporter ATP-binding protein [Clostridiales bacterium]
MSGFEVRDLSCGYGARKIVSGLSFSMEKGTLMGVLGANGSGKTTLLKGICGILPHGGSCELEGTRLEGLSEKKIARLLSYIPQRSGIAIDISALDVVLMGFNPRLGLLEHPGPSMKKAACDMLEAVGLGGREHENYMHLSEGQKQLCILARTLVAESRLLLLDEPESALDFRFRYRMLKIIRDWVNEGDRYGLVALHDPMLALNYCDELLLLKDGCSMGVLRPKEDPREKAEAMLSCIYGPVSLAECKNRAGESQIVMLREQEEER